MPRSYAIVTLLGLLMFLPINTIAATKYVSVESENLRDSPNGEKLGVVLKGTQLTELEQMGKWSKVTITGWIYAPSLSSTKVSPTAEHLQQSAAGAGFFYKNVSFRSDFMGIGCVGEMTNGSSKDYQIANFVLSVYDGAGKLLETTYISISSFAAGSTKSFDTYLMNSTLSNIKSYKVQYENGF